MRCALTSLVLLLGCANRGAALDGAEAGAERPPAADERAYATETYPDAGVVDVAHCSVACTSATPRNPVVGPDNGTGNVTMYTTEASAGGACNYGSTGVQYFVAVNVNVASGDGRGQWNAGRVCGQCAEVTAITSKGPQSVVVRIMDKCPDQYCGVDLGGLAPATIMLDGFGRYDGWWRFVSCSGHPEVSDGAPSLFVVAGSNAWWSRVQIRNPPWAVESIDWQDPAGGARGALPYASDPENTFEVPADVLQSKAAALVITVHYGDGTQATVRLSPSALATGSASYPLDS